MEKKSFLSQKDSGSFECTRTMGACSSVDLCNVNLRETRKRQTFKRNVGHAATTFFGETVCVLLFSNLNSVISSTYCELKLLLRSDISGRLTESNKKAKKQKRKRGGELNQMWNPRFYEQTVFSSMYQDTHVLYSILYLNMRRSDKGRIFGGIFWNRNPITFVGGVDPPTYP